MIPDILLNNLLPWAVQVCVIGSVGATLPLVFRIRHPRSQLVYCHLLLVVCLVLPVIQVCPFRRHLLLRHRRHRRLPYCRERFWTA
jgi:hypothetical protein